MVGPKEEPKGAPGVLHHVHNGLCAAALGVGDGKGDQGEDEHQHTADEQRFLLARTLAEEGLIEVRREGAGGDEQLRIRRGDGRGDDGREQQTADARREELAGHGDENELLVAVGEQLLAHDHAPEIGDHNGGEEGNDDPDDGHNRGLLDHRGLLDGHEAHKDVAAYRSNRDPSRSR